MLCVPLSDPSLCVANRETPGFHTWCFGRRRGVWCSASDTRMGTYPTITFISTLATSLTVHRDSCSEPKLPWRPSPAWASASVFLQAAPTKVTSTKQPSKSSPVSTMPALQPWFVQPPSPTYPTEI